MAAGGHSADRAWWREAVIYHIYPRSFQDSDGDGIGDLPGILSRLDYLNDGTGRSLGVDAIWLSPVFPSPLADFGYDVADYYDVDRVYGGLGALDRLIAACHERGVRVLLDFVLNHTSDRHPWFVESRRSRETRRRDWYYWRDPAADGGPPNNWESAFGGPAWTFDEATGQYYLHSFLPEQPDLNWQNPEVVEAMAEVMRFWMRRGVDGFRLDAAGWVLKHPELLDNPMREDGPTAKGLVTARVHNYISSDAGAPWRFIRSVIDEFPERVTVGEAYVPPEVLPSFLHPPAYDGLHLMFNFQLIRHNQGEPFTPWAAPVLAKRIHDSEVAIPPPGLTSYAIGNHDVPRFVSRHNGDGRGQERARAAALLQMALRGVPCVYMGDEIGMVDAAVPPKRRLDRVGRDPARTPMQWDRTPGRGFSSGEPWLPFGPESIDVASQLDDPHSTLSLYRRAIWTRKREPALLEGALHGVRADNDVLTFCRGHASAPGVFVAVNTAATERVVHLPHRFEHILLDTGGCGIERTNGEARIRLPGLAAAWVKA
ncbi:MAG: alpha-amylase family glycosyl hydrolase [Dehalococcoidia bacterium]